MKLLFLVNGSEQSAAGTRTQAFLQRLPQEWGVRVAYRPARKWKGIVPFVQEALRFRPDVIYVMDTAYTGVLAGTIAKKLTRTRLVTDTGDVAYELAKSSGTYSGMQLTLIRTIEQMALRNSDCMVVRGSYHKTLLEQQGLRSVVFIPDGVDLETVKGANPKAIRQRLGLSDSLVVGMVGTMLWSERHGMCYGWDIIEALALLKDAPVKALLIGDGDGRSKLEQRAQELGVSANVVFTGTVPFVQLPDYLAAMDVSVSTQSNDLVGKVRTTGKLPLYLACGSYVIATDVGEAGRVLPGVGGLLPYEGVRDDAHPARLAAHIRQLLQEPVRREVQEKARQVAKDNFEYQLLADRVKTICETLRQGTDVRAAIEATVSRGA